MGAAVCIDTVGANASGNAMPSTTGKLLLQAGAATALPWALGEKRGVVSIVDVYGPTDNLVPIGNLMNKGITMRGNQTSVKRLLPRLIEYVQAGRLNPKGIITHRVPLEEVADAYHIFSAGLDECTKPVLVPSSARAQSHS